MTWNVRKCGVTYITSCIPLCWTYNEFDEGIGGESKRTREAAET